MANDSESEDQATLDALERYRADGSDLSRPMTMDFFVSAPTQDAAQAIAASCTSLGFTSSVEHTERFLARRSSRSSWIESFEPL